MQIDDESSRTPPAADNSACQESPSNVLAPPPPIAAKGSSVPASTSEFDRSLMHGIAWTGAARWGTQILTWATTLVVARLLSPEDYGLVGMASVYIGLVTLVNEFGIGSSIVIVRNLTRQQLAHLNGVVVVFGFAWFVLSCLMAGPIARLYGVEEVRGIVLGLSLNFVITSLRTISYSQLEKELRFKSLAVMETIQAIVASITTLVLAWIGWAYWALVWGTLAGSVASTTVALIQWPHPLARPKFHGAALRIGSHILLGRLMWYFYSHADVFIVGKTLGKAALGFYSFGFTMATLPASRITNMVMKVVPAFFSAVQNDRASLRRVFLNVTEGLAIATFPAALGLALVSKEFVLVILGDKWSEAIAPLQLLAIYAIFRCIQPLLSYVHNVTGYSSFGLRVGILPTVLLPVGFYFGSRFGVTGVAAVWLLLHPLLAIPSYWRAFRTLDLTLGVYLRALWPGLSASIAMAAAVLVVKQLFGETGSLALRLGVEVAVGAVTYALVLFALHRQRVKAMIRLLKGLRG